MTLWSTAGCSVADDAQTRVRSISDGSLLRLTLIRLMLPVTPRRLILLCACLGQVWHIAASVLHLSNLRFDTIDHEQGEVASVADRAVRVRTVARYLFRLSTRTTAWTQAALALFHTNGRLRSSAECCRNIRTQCARKLKRLKTCLSYGLAVIFLVWQALATLAELLGVEEVVMEAMLTQRVVTTRGEIFTKQLSVQDASFTRDAIVKSLYEVGYFATVLCHHLVLLQTLDFSEGHVSKVLQRPSRRNGSSSAA